MMYLRNYTKKILEDRSESGVYMVIVAGTLISMLAILGYAIDSGTLYQNEINLKRATSAAAISAASVLAIQENNFCNPGGNPALDALASETARRTIRENLTLNGFSNAEATQAVNNAVINVVRGDGSGNPCGLTDLTDINSGTVFNPLFAVQVSTSIDADLILMDFASGANNMQSTSASSSRIKPAVITAILDTSGSMNCSDGPLVPNDPCDDSSPTSRIKVLKNAFKNNFLNFLDPGRDYLTVVTFNRHADVKYNRFPWANPIPNNPIGGFHKGNVEWQIDNNISTGNATNIIDGLVAGGNTAFRLLNATGMEEFESAYVLFTDGAPTAGRFIFTAPIVSPTGDLRTTLPDGTIAPGSLTRKDFYLWSTRWDDTSTTPNTVLGFGASQLSEPPSNCPRVHGLPKACGPDPLCDPEIDACYPPDCSTRTSPYAAGQTAPENGVDEIKNCFNRFKFRTWALSTTTTIHYPTSNIGSGTGIYAIDDKGTVDTSDDTPSARVQEIINGRTNTYLEQIFISTIAWADELRRNRGIIYAIGFGAEPDPAEDFPFQGLTDTLRRRDNLMNRIALSRSAAPGSSLIGRFYDFPGVFSREQLWSDEPHESGADFVAQNGADLQRVFEAIVAKIKLRNIS